MKTIQDLKIIFLGTPDFAVASLDALIQAGMNVIAVVTAPDKPSGRGLQLQSSAVKKHAESNSIRVLQPVKLKDPSFVDELKSLHADLQVVVAFRMLPEIVWNMPPMGTINVHASLLPQYRGAAPINWAVINGEKDTGVTTFKLKHEIDTGDILLQAHVPILPEDNAGTLHDKLMLEGAKLLVKTVEGLTDDTIREVPQSNISATLQHAPKLFKEDMCINWNRPVNAIHQLIRGLSPSPAAFTVLKGKQLKVYQAHTEPGATNADAGEFDTDHKTYLRFAARDGWVYIDELQLEGKKRMQVVEFLKGFR
ncbi:MAG TPA: methionyl-tRNA formyltransferase [Flavipsychrobacter sp.]|nr:methionyl-tRNA formyltransferase [Flavipsychrobacter sp.]